MSVRPIFTVWCDHEPCGEWEAQEESRRSAVAAARRYGWRRKQGRDLCPLHGGMPAEAHEEFKMRHRDHYYPDTARSTL